MIRSVQVILLTLSLGALAALPPTAIADDTDTATTTSTEPVKKLSPQMTQLRDRVRQAVANQYAQGFTTQGSSSTTAMYYCLAFGKRAAVYNNNKRVSAIGCLCYNYSFGGYRPLTLIDGRPAARVGLGRQQQPGQLLAVLAQSQIAQDYPLKVGEEKFTVADLIEHEKRACCSGRDLSLPLVGLAYYLGASDTWTNREGETWSIERMVDEELDKPLEEAPYGGTHRLLGLSYAIKQWQAADRPLTDTMQEAADYVTKMQDFALRIQNSNGSWHPQFFTARGRNRNKISSLVATGHILQWLVYSLPEEKLEDPKVVRSVALVASTLSSDRYTSNVPALPEREIEAVMHATRALSLYDQRVFVPADPPKQEEHVAEKSTKDEAATR